MNMAVDKTFTALQQRAVNGATRYLDSDQDDALSFLKSIFRTVCVFFIGIIYRYVRALFDISSTANDSIVSFRESHGMAWYGSTQWQAELH
jgi:hypothetical protein